MNNNYLSKEEAISYLTVLKTGVLTSLVNNRNDLVSQYMVQAIEYAITCIKEHDELYKENK